MGVKNHPRRPETKEGLIGRAELGMHDRMKQFMKWEY
jgi:hypothetical protein